MKIEITPENVKAAYDRHPEIKPLRGQFTDYSDGKLCGACALSILALDAGLLSHVYKDESVTSLMTEATGIDSDRLWNFVRGFDYEDESLTKDHFYKMGFTDVDWNLVRLGQTTRKLVFGDG